ncbi:uncharacterized protein LACBIDRAFT_336017 [Laccaria bicolor S238N-H82]|uniref:Predicted protein n=1 Tax=Laccaria bicolor (strain S238N-H82 / ATCC MYA-4686) TaxID=486041 RepID=B0E458_LACBS|nr:uncharacterized protein LACBIDRAFT_336017 [Laccaria bicolor S238N-H82]EDQ98373.1 predicted protein [Laccaria bicolor S238N-H82]|eukprot:XP_001890977.1 predicted protein [Laccaria bicolor S238N-H82]
MTCWAKREFAQWPRYVPARVIEVLAGQPVFHFPNDPLCLTTNNTEDEPEIGHKGSSHNEKAQLANTLWAAHPATPWVIRVEFPFVACPNGEKCIIEQVVFSNASTNRFRPFPPGQSANSLNVQGMYWQGSSSWQVQTHPTKGKERIRSVSKLQPGENFIIEQSPPTPGQIGMFAPSEGIMKVGRYRLSTMAHKGAAVDLFTLPDVNSSSGRFKPFLPKGKARIRSMAKEGSLAELPRASLGAH